MDSFLEQKILKLKQVEYVQTVFFSSIWLILFAFCFNYSYRMLMTGPEKTVITVVVIYLGTIAIFCKLLWKVLGKITLTISDDTLLVNYRIFSIGIAKKYKIHSISNLRLRNDAKSSFYLRSIGIRTYGTTSALSFNYIKEEIDIKGNLSESDFALLKQWIKN